MEPLVVFKVPAYQRPTAEVLDEAGAIRCMTAAILAARELLSDAVFLYRHGRYARAGALAVLALEEVGKVKVIARVAESVDDSSRRKAWKEYTAHRAKASENIGGGEWSVEESQDAFAHQADSLKQLSFYSNLLSTGEWVWPAKVVSPQNAEIAVNWASAMVSQLDKFETNFPDASRQ